MHGHCSSEAPLRPPRKEEPKGPYDAHTHAGGHLGRILPGLRSCRCRHELIEELEGRVARATPLHSVLIQVRGVRRPRETVTEYLRQRPAPPGTQAEGQAAAVNAKRAL